MKPPQKNQIICGNNLEVVESWPANCIDSLVTDPPYGLGFMGKEWDTLIEKTRDSAGGFLRNGKSGSNPYAAARCRHGSDSQQMQQWYYQWAKAMLRITKPGGFLLCFGGTRTYHRLACAIEDAGWEIRDCMMWLYGSGFPKSHDISKAIDKAAGAKRKVIGDKGYTSQDIRGNAYDSDRAKERERLPAKITAPATELAQLWEGYGTALKPAVEPILLCQKPLTVVPLITEKEIKLRPNWEPIIVAMKPKEGSFADNAEKYGVAGLNIDGGRIGHNEPQKFTTRNNKMFLGQMNNTDTNASANPQGRWPANLILDEEVVQNESWKRYFYCAKTSRKERNMGMEDCEDKLLARSGGAQGAENRGEKEYLQKHIGLNRVAVVKNNHPTVKPLALMKYLCTLLKMPSAEQIILDPFLGSGTTGMACKELGIDFIGIEKEREYCEIAVKRIAAVDGAEVTLQAETPKPSLPVTKNLPHVSESRQKIINAASAELRKRRNQK